MNILYNNNNIEFDNILFIQGSNKTGKTKILKDLEKGFNGELKDFFINNNRIYKGDYKTYYIGDYNNFATDFKMTKSNTFKKLLFDEIINNINIDNILNKCNQLFDIIDDKVNDILKHNNYTNEIQVNTNIDSVDKVLEKFCNIYIEDFLLDENITPRSILRKLLINLTLYQISTNKHDNNIVFIDDFDNSFDDFDLYKLINSIENIDNTKFIVTSSRNIYKYVNNKSDIFKLYHNKLTNIRNMEYPIKQAIIVNEYNNTNNTNDLNSFYEENEFLINEEDIRYFKENILNKLSFEIGLLYCNDDFKISNNFYDNSFINVSNNLEKCFLEIIYSILTNNIDNDN